MQGEGVCWSGVSEQACVYLCRVPYLAVARTFERIEEVSAR